MAKYNPQKIEKKWQKRWERESVFQARDGAKKPKFYALVEFPYPSGEGLHVGHCRSYVGMDIICRKKRMEGYNVLFPMGWDAFGLPTENYAIKTGIHPAIATKKNTANFKRQEKSLGLSFDWSREIDTTDPNYYKWTQWIFVQLFKKGLAYKAKMPVNWCLSCKIGLANEEVVNGKCERCGGNVEKREKEQWILKITKYSDRLIEDLDKVDYPEKIKTLQKDWIGKSEGWEINFNLKSQISNVKCIKVFTTRIDTLFGATYLVLASEHHLIEELKDKIANYKFVKEYIVKAGAKLDKERLVEEKEKTGVELKGIKAVNPVNGREIPIFVADYVLMSYGKGAIMAVPSHDQRDFDFAQNYNLQVVEVIKPAKEEKKSLKEVPIVVAGGRLEKAYEGEGILINSGRFDGMRSEAAKERIGEWLARRALAQKAVNYKLRDWIFSRQRYWGEPIPMIYCQKCVRLPDGQGWSPVPEKDLPVLLPEVKNYKPTEKGESPLAHVEKWVNTTCPSCGGAGRRETDVMPNWAGSNWYYLAYAMLGNQKSKIPRPSAVADSGAGKNKKYIWDKRKIKYWMPVDWYNGGMEHVTLHLLYSRFIYKFLWDIGAVPKTTGPEPYKKRTAHGVILGEGGTKMSKSKGNVVNPDDVVRQYGADAMRIYEMFMGPFDQMIPWGSKGVVGARRFLEKVWNLQDKLSGSQKTKGSDNLRRLLNKTIKKVSQDIDSLKFNTAISSLMEFVNAWRGNKDGLGRNDARDFLKILYPFAPHIAEEMWQTMGNKKSVHLEKWPKFDEKLVKDEIITIVVQINGKVRDKIEVEVDANEEKVKQMALASEKVKKWLEGKEIKKTIFVAGKLINLVVS